MEIYEELKARGLIAQVTDEEQIRDLVNNGKATFYIGFDCTADSLHVGHFMALCLMKRLQMAGNKPIALIGENASTLISLMFPLMRRIRASSGAHETILSDTEQAGAYFLDLFFGEREEKLYEACLDAKGRLLACHLIAEGNTESVQLNMRKIVENALKCGASSVLLSHNHPSGVALPSPADNATTLSVFDALRTVGVELADHIIVADDDFVSLRHNGLLPERKGNGYGI